MYSPYLIFPFSEALAGLCLHFAVFHSRRPVLYVFVYIRRLFIFPRVLYV